MIQLDKKFFEIKEVCKVCAVLYSSKCFMCKKEFKDVLYDHKWNTDYLVHLKTTHGIDPEMLFLIMKKIINSND